MNVTYAILSTIAIILLVFLSFIVLKKRHIQSVVTRLIKKKHHLQHKILQQNHFLDTLFDHSMLGTGLLNLGGQFLKVNKSLGVCLGYTQEDMLQMNFFNITNPKDLNKLQLSLQDLISKKESVYQAEQQLVKKNGDLISIMLTLSIVNNYAETPAYCIIQIQNVTLQKKSEERLRHMAFHDPLTGLPNRSRLEQFVNEIVLSAMRQEKKFALLFLDLDHFKNINDTMGHETGDLILQIVAEKLLSCVRATDCVARLSGDEFVVLMTDVNNSQDLYILADKILQQILETITIQGKEIYMTTSIGIALYPHDGKNLQALLKHADLALYRAKELGRNNYQFFQDEMSVKAREKLFLQRELGAAITKNEFLLHYQPKMKLSTRQVTGLEVFLRWKNPELGSVPPNEIIAIAEETGLILPVSSWITKTACQQLKKWHEAGFKNISIAINCARRQFKQPTFVADILKLLEELDLPPHALELEITESLITEETEDMLKVLHALKDKGIQIVIDDFGMGYWSLNNLRHLSVDKIKIDKTFIKNVTVDETSRAITKAIIAMCNKLQINTVAEGVENKAQYDFLLTEGCTEIQGYYLTQPLNAERMTTYLQHPIPDAESISKGELVC